MNEYLLLIVFLFPLLGALLSRSSVAPYVGMLASAIALLAALCVPTDAGLVLEWVLMGMELGLDRIDKWFLAAAGIIWFSASLYALFSMAEDSRSSRFWFFFLLAMSGNFALIVGQDLMTFYLGFTVMGLASYGLVIHSNAESARYAGKIYLIMTLLGEFALFVAFILLQSNPSPAYTLTLQLLLILAFGIKAGMFGLHMWLPLAHPAAPIAASAVLSGVMIKAGLLGLVRFLPIGDEVLFVPGMTLLVLGLAGVVLGTIFGVLQGQAKIVLAYSSIAKMGLMLAALGLAALEPPLAPAILLALAIFALHHGLVKAALFFTVGVAHTVQKRWLWLTVVPIASMVGLPYTSGSAAKDALKNSLGVAVSDESQLLLLILTIASIGSVLLMSRFMMLVLKEAAADRPILNGIIAPWLLLMFASIFLAFLLGPVSFSVTDILPIALAGVACGLVIATNTSPNWPSVPAGDVLVLFKCLARYLAQLRSFAGKQHFTMSFGQVRLRVPRYSQSIIESKLFETYSVALLWFLVLILLFVAQFVILS